MGSDVSEADLMGKAVRDLSANANRKRTICEVHREIFDLVYAMEASGTRDKIIDLLVEATFYAKKMSKRLHEYNRDWEKGFYGENPDYAEDVQHRKAGRPL